MSWILHTGDDNRKRITNALNPIVYIVMDNHTIFIYGKNCGVGICRTIPQEDPNKTIISSRFYSLARYLKALDIENNVALDSLNEQGEGDIISNLRNVIGE